MTSEIAGEAMALRRIVVKVGTSTLTQGGGPPDVDYIAELARQIVEQRALGRSVILVTSGSIRAGMHRLNLSGRPQTIPQKQAAAAIGQGLLMHSYSEAFAAYGVPVAQVLLTREDFRERERYLNARNTFAAILKYGAVPIVNENDTVAVDEIRFGDNDTLGALVSSLVGADALLLLSDVDGLFDRDPTQYPDAKLIPIVETVDRSVEQRATGARTSMGTGGMMTKVRAAKICAGTGVRMTIANGRAGNAIARAISGEIGTLFVPSATSLRHRKRWIAYGAAPKGAITVNDGAKQRLVEEGKSLLPAGVIEIRGHFRPGELVQLLDQTGSRFAQGFVNYGDEDLTKIMGLRTTEIAAVLGVKTRDEVVHRDDLVLDIA
jgi:glutamate 5-kinase